MVFSTDVIHSGHIDIIEKAAELGELTVGVLSDEVVASYKRYPVLPVKERMKIVAAINGVAHVVLQDTLSYKSNLEKLKPDYVVHGDDWKTGYQKSTRQEVIETLDNWGGELVEYPYASNESIDALEAYAKAQLSIPDIRRRRLKELLAMKPIVTAIETHSGLTGLIAEETKVEVDGEIRQFDAMWVSSLCDSTQKGKPDIELVDMTSRFRTIDDIMEVTTKPVVFDGDTGGLIEHFVYTVSTLERMGVSAVIIEDKVGLKKNSLFGTDVEQTQDTIEHFSEKIAAGKKALKTQDMLIIARIESLILEQGMDDALERAHAYVHAGADGIMIHSRKKDPAEIFEFCDTFRETNKDTPIVIVPSSFNQISLKEFAEHKINLVIYANQLTRSSYPAMVDTAKSILEHGRSYEVEKNLMPIKEILTLIPEL